MSPFCLSSPLGRPASSMSGPFEGNGIRAGSLQRRLVLCVRADEEATKLRARSAREARAVSRAFALLGREAVGAVGLPVSAARIRWVDEPDRAGAVRAAPVVSRDVDDATAGESV